MTRHGRTSIVIAVIAGIMPGGVPLAGGCWRRFHRLPDGSAGQRWKEARDGSS